MTASSTSSVIAHWIMAGHLAVSYTHLDVYKRQTASRAPENTPAMVKKIGKTTYKVHVHFSNTSTETMSDKIKRMLKNEIQQM